MFGDLECTETWGVKVRYRGTRTRSLSIPDDTKEGKASDGHTGPLTWDRRQGMGWDGATRSPRVDSVTTSRVGVRPQGLVRIYQTHAWSCRGLDFYDSVRTLSTRYLCLKRRRRQTRVLKVTWSTSLYDPNLRSRSRRHKPRVRFTPFFLSFAPTPKPPRRTRDQNLEPFRTLSRDKN